MSTPARSVRSLAESYWAAEAQRDIDAVMSHYHSDATYQDAGGRRHGAAETGPSTRVPSRTTRDCEWTSLVSTWPPKAPPWSSRRS